MLNLVEILWKYVILEFVAQKFVFGDFETRLLLTIELEIETELRR